MKTYIGQEENPRKKSTWVVSILLGAFLLVYGTVVGSWYGQLIGLLLLVVSVFKRTLTVSEEGFTMTYHLVRFQHKVLWSFGQIDAIHWGKQKEGDTALIYFGKGLSVKGMVCQQAEVAEILDWVRENYSTIKIEEFVPKKSKK